MGTGYLTVNVRTAFDALPKAGARVTIKGQDGAVLYQTTTDANGNTDYFPLTAPDMKHTLDPNWLQPAYSVVDVTVSADGFQTVQIHGVEIVDTQRTILPVQLHPLEEGYTAHANLEEHIYLGPVGLLLPGESNQIGPPGTRAEQAGPPGTRAAQASPQANIAQAFNEVTIPNYITVHLGTPQNAAARNVRVPFIDYIKNVVSSEIYSTWPHNSIVANVHVIVTFALNRLFTEWYRSRGYNFDITNSTQYDQYYRYGGPIFENVSRIVDSIFNVYAKRAGFLNPFFTQYCNGTTVTCPGLSQWGTVTLANQGRTPLEILRFYYPKDLELVTTNRIADIPESYPGYSLSIGSSGDHVRRIQTFLNRIRINYPLIPAITNPNGVFDAQTQEAVRVFQRTFNMTQDGIVGRATWNRITQIFVGVTRLGELNSEGIRNSIGAAPPNVVLSQGSRGEHVLELQFILNMIAEYYEAVPSVIQDSYFGAGTQNAVREFQREFGLHPDGIVGPATWNKLYSIFRGIENNVSVPPPPGEVRPPTTYPGSPLRVGSRGADVRLMQSYLNVIRTAHPSIPRLAEDGIFGPITESAVIAFQRAFGLVDDGIIGPITWNRIVEQYGVVTGGGTPTVPPKHPPYPGTPLRVGSRGENVRLMQQLLSDLRRIHPSLLAIAVDGIFGPQTQAAVVAFQRLFGLTPDGIIGPITWNAITSRHAAM